MEDAESESVEHKDILEQIENEQVALVYEMARLEVEHKAQIEFLKARNIELLSFREYFTKKNYNI